MNSIVKVGEVSSANKTIWRETIKINGKAVEFKIDTGSEINIIPLEVYKSVAQSGNQQMRQTRTLLQAYGGSKIKPVGKVSLECKSQSKNEILEFYVVDLKVKSILGLPSIQKLEYIKRVNNVNEISNKEKFIQSNIDVLTGLGTFENSCTISLKKDSIPVARPYRRVPLVIKNRLKSKLDQLEK